MKKPAIFFDRDNTLIANDGYLADPRQVRLIPGAASAVARARAMGFAVVIISNQSGVARGMFTEDTVDVINKRLDQILSAENPQATIDRHEFCPFHPEATVEKYRQDSDLRKPKPGMILKAAHELELDLSSSWVIGDAPRDIEAGHTAGCRTILVHDRSLTPSPASEEEGATEPDESVATIAEAMDIIEAFVGTESLHQHSVRGNLPAQVNEVSRLEHLTQQILDQVRRQHEHMPEFSLGKMFAGITQILAIAVAVASYFFRSTGETNTLLLVAIFLQALTISLLLMGRDK
jgi:D,D-heptose 1,7-bisphosphate phosphatase